MTSQSTEASTAVEDPSAELDTPLLHPEGTTASLSSLGSGNANGNGNGNGSAAVYPPVLAPPAARTGGGIKASVRADKREMAKAKMIDANRIKKKIAMAGLVVFW